MRRILMVSLLAVTVSGCSMFRSQETNRSPFNTTVSPSWSTTARPVVEEPKVTAKEDQPRESWLRRVL